jgi:hypothetical protein
VACCVDGVFAGARRSRLTFSAAACTTTAAPDSAAGGAPWLRSATVHS